MYWKDTPEDLKLLLGVLQLIRKSSPSQQRFQVRLLFCLLQRELDGEMGKQLRFKNKQMTV